MFLKQTRRDKEKIFTCEPTYLSMSYLTVSLRTVENSPVKDFSRLRSSQRDALNNISKGLKPLFATLFTRHKRHIKKMFNHTLIECMCLLVAVLVSVRMDVSFQHYGCDI